MAGLISGTLYVGSSSSMNYNSGILTPTLSYCTIDYSVVEVKDSTNALSPSLASSITLSPMGAST